MFRKCVCFDQERSVLIVQGWLNIKTNTFWDFFVCSALLNYERWTLKTKHRGSRKVSSNKPPENPRWRSRSKKSNYVIGTSNVCSIFFLQVLIRGTRPTVNSWNNLLTWKIKENTNDWEKENRTKQFKLNRSYVQWSRLHKSTKQLGLSRLQW